MSDKEPVELLLEDAEGDNLVFSFESLFLNVLLELGASNEALGSD